MGVEDELGSNRSYWRSIWGSRGFGDLIPFFYTNSPVQQASGSTKPDAYCASGADGGAVGIHFVNFGLVDDVLNPVEPEVLYYEPLPGGGIRLVGARGHHP